MDEDVHRSAAGCQYPGATTLFLDGQQFALSRLFVGGDSRR